MKYFIFILVFFLCSCAELNSKNHTTETRSGNIGKLALAILESNDTASKCDQGHAQDRIDCRKRKQAQVDAINKSITEHTVQ